MSHYIIRVEWSFDSFISNEERLNREFLEVVGGGVNFSEEDYSFLKVLWEDEKFIEEIYMTVEKLRKKMGVRLDTHHIVGDMLFSFCGKELKDPHEIFLKVSRKLYFTRLDDRIFINYIWDEDYRTYKLLHQRLLMSLRGKGIIEREVITAGMGLSRVKDKICEMKYIRIVHLKLKINVNKVYLHPNVSEFTYRHWYWCGTLYSVASFRNIIRTIRNKRGVKGVEIPLDGVSKSNKIQFYLSSWEFRQSLEIIEREKRILLERNRCESIEEYFKKIEWGTMQIPEGKEENITIGEVDNKLSEGERYKELMRSFQKIVQIKMLEQDIWDKSFYLPNFLDGRGRQYSGSYLSPTFNVILRYFYRYQKEKIGEWREMEKSIYVRKIMKYKHMVSNKLDDKTKYYKLILLIEVGKFFIKGSGKFKFKTEEIIIEGENAYRERRLRGKTEDIYLNRIYSELDSIEFDGSVDENTVIFKDATASGLMNYSILLGCKEEMKEFLNLKGDDYCDTYQYLVNKYVDGEEKYKKRKYWKGTVMKIPYGSVWFTALCDMLEEMEEDGIVYSRMPKPKKEELKKMHLNFYNIIKDKLKGEFYEKSEGNKIKFEYYRPIIVEQNEYKVNYEKMRDKYTNELVMWIEDYGQSERAEEANNLHWLDAVLMRYVMKHIEVIGIHDCFGVRLCEVHKLMDRINEYYGNKDKKSYALHIII